MTSRKRSQRKRRKGKKRTRSKPQDRQTAARNAPPVIKTLGDRILAEGPDYFEDNFVRIMQESSSLRQEPEFADLYFAPEQTLDISMRHFSRFSHRLERASRRGTEAAAPVYDDYRIAVINDLETVQFRRELQRRLGQCIDRFQHSRDADKMEIALFTSVLLGDKAEEIVGEKDKLPLGVYGLVTTIYEDSFDRAVQEIPDARDVIGDDLYTLWCAKHHRKDMEALTVAAEQVGVFEDWVARIETDSALALAWKRQERYLVEELESRIIQTELAVTPSTLFTLDEITLAMDKMEQRHLSKPWSLSRYLAVPALANFAFCIRETLDEIVSPKRIAEMIERFRSAGQKALESDDEQQRALLPYIQAAIHHLQCEPTPSRNQVVRAMFSLSFLNLADDVDVSPRWQRLFERLKKSRFLRNVDVDDDL